MVQPQRRMDLDGFPIALGDTAGAPVKALVTIWDGEVTRAGCHDLSKVSSPLGGELKRLVGEAGATKHLTGSSSATGEQVF